MLGGVLLGNQEAGLLPGQDLDLLIQVLLRLLHRRQIQGPSLGLRPELLIAGAGPVLGGSRLQHLAEGDDGGAVHLAALIFCLNVDVIKALGFLIRLRLDLIRLPDQRLVVIAALGHAVLQELVGGEFALPVLLVELLRQVGHVQLILWGQEDPLEEPLMLFRPGIGQIHPGLLARLDDAVGGALGQDGLAHEALGLLTAVGKAGHGLKAALDDAESGLGKAGGQIRRLLGAQGVDQLCAGSLPAVDAVGGDKLIRGLQRGGHGLLHDLLHRDAEDLGIVVQHQNARQLAVTGEVHQIFIGDGGGCAPQGVHVALVNLGLAELRLRPGRLHHAVGGFLDRLVILVGLADLLHAAGLDGLLQVFLGLGDSKQTVGLAAGLRPGGVVEFRIAEAFQTEGLGAETVHLVHNALDVPHRLLGHAALQRPQLRDALHKLGRFMLIDIRRVVDDVIVAVPAASLGGLQILGVFLPFLALEELVGVGIHHVVGIGLHAGQLGFLIIRQ